MLIVARDISGSASTRAVVVQGLVHRLQHLGVAAHAEVVVGAPYGDLLVLGFLVGAREFLGQAIDIVEVAVRLVLVLLVQLILIESLIVEFLGVRSSGLSSIEGLGGGGLLNGRRERNWSWMMS